MRAAYGRWTNTETAVLRDELAAGRSFDQAAVALRRSVGGCKARARQLNIRRTSLPGEPSRSFERLTATEARLTLCLANNAPGVVTFEEFAPMLGFAHPVGMNGLVRVHIAHLRRKGVVIETRRGVGYWMSVGQAEIVLSWFPASIISPNIGVI